MINLYFKYNRVIARFRCGALGNEIDHIAASFSKAGYKHGSAKLYLARIAHFSAYSARSGYGKSRPIPREIIQRYLRSRPTIAALQQARQAINQAAQWCPNRFVSIHVQEQKDPNRSLIEAFLQHLRTVRGLKMKTCEGQILTARRVLAWQRKHLPGKPLSDLAAKHVLVMTRDLLSECCSDSAKGSTTAYMRSFLRYLYWMKISTQELAQFVPKVPHWRQTHLPPRLAWEDVRRAIDAIDTTKGSGLRDRAVMLLLATTGMRNGELRQLELGAIRWQTGELVLRHTKGHRDRVVPLLDETGEALAAYLLRARPRTRERRVFLSNVAPVRSLPYASTVSRIVRSRLQSVGIPIKRGGAHLLRHSLATRLVEQRRPIKEVADLLGHRSIDTSSIYVKVAVPQLTEVALPFPGGVQ